MTRPFPSTAQYTADTVAGLAEARAGRVVDERVAPNASVVGASSRPGRC